jgi:hypothetical protein
METTKEFQSSEGELRDSISSFGEMEESEMPQNNESTEAEISYKDAGYLVEWDIPYSKEHPKHKYGILVRNK